MGGGNNTASSNNAFIGAGFCNNVTDFSSMVGSGCQSTASGRYSVVMGGAENVASGCYSSVTGGLRTNAYLYGQQGQASGVFSATGDAQATIVTARQSPSLNTGGTAILSLDGTGATNLLIPDGNNRSWAINVSWTAVVTGITGTATGVTIGDTKVSTDLLALAKRSGVTSVSAHTSLGTRVVETSGGSLTAVNITYSAGASQQLQITFTGPTFAGGGSVTMRVVAKVELTEVAY
jgi:hypothetical protein